MIVQRMLTASSQIAAQSFNCCDAGRFPIVESARIGSDAAQRYLTTNTEHFARRTMVEAFEPIT